MTTKAAQWKSGSHDAAVVVAKNMGSTTRAFWKPTHGRRGFIFGGGVFFWLILGFFYIMFLELKVGLWLCIEALLLAFLVAYGITYAVSSYVVSRQLKGVQAPPERPTQELPLTVNLPGPRDWSPASEIDSK